MLLPGVAWLMVPALLTSVVATHQDRGGSLPIGVSAAGALPVPSAPAVEVGLRLETAAPETLEVVRLSRIFPAREWQLAEIQRLPRDRLVLRAPAGLDTLLLFRSPLHAGYMLDGPFRWPSLPSTYVIAPRWRRTVRARGPSPASGPIRWMPAEDDVRPDGWPLCGRLPEGWECVGVPLDAAGVLVMGSPPHLHGAVATGATLSAGVESLTPEQVGWGRLIIVDGARVGGVRALGRIRAAAMRPAVVRDSDSAWVPEGISDAHIRVMEVGPRAFWVAGREPAVDGWLEIGGAGLAAARIAIRDVAGGSPEAPMRVSLDAGVALSGRVLTGPGEGAGGAVLALYRFMTLPSGSATEARVLVREVLADDDGRFRIDDLAMDRYEIVATHPALGQARQTCTPGMEPLKLVVRR